METFEVSKTSKVWLCSVTERSGLRNLARRFLDLPFPS
jgi:hypothetical protein